MRKEIYSQMPPEKQIQLMEAKEIAINAKFRKSACRLGQKNPNFKGKEANIRSIKAWLCKHKKRPKFCEWCGIHPPKDLFTRGDPRSRKLGDWAFICRSCSKRQLVVPLSEELRLQRYNKKMEYNRRYNEKHKTQILLKNKEYRENHKEELAIKRRIEKQKVISFPYLEKKLKTMEKTERFINLTPIR